MGQKTADMFPKDYFTHGILGRAYQGKSMSKEAIAEFEKAKELSDRNHAVLISLGLTYYEEGERAKVEKLFNEIMQRSKHEYIPSLYIFIYSSIPRR